MANNKEVIFISHAVPDDDYLAIWLATKLSLLGYNVWVDKEDLRSGNAFWNEIDDKIRQQSIRFLALISSSYIDKSKDKDTGVFLELNAAKTVSKQIKDYIIPIRVDKSNFDDFPLITLGIDAIDFSENWGTGLKKLLKEFEIQSIPKNVVELNTLSLWHKYQGIQGKVINQKEHYGSNWFLCDLPEKLTVYKFYGDLKELTKHIPFQFVRNENYCIGFFEDSGLELQTEFREDILVKDFISQNNYILKSGDEIKDTVPKFVGLMNKAIYEFFALNEDFEIYYVKKRNKIAYVLNTRSESGYVSFTRNGVKKRRVLKGSKPPISWNFGLSFNFQLEPFPHYVANHHIISLDENGYLKKDDQLKYRRSIPAEWYNRDWFERILAFMNLASGLQDNGELYFQSGRETIRISLNTVGFQSNKSYEES